MDFRIFGSLGIARDGSELRVPTGKPRLLRAMLLCHSNEPVPRERLVDVLWGADPPKSAGDNLRVYVSQLRKTLGDSALIVRDSGGNALRVKPGELDADRFEELLVAARACDDPAGAGAVLRKAVGHRFGPRTARAGTAVVRDTGLMLLARWRRRPDTSG
jgi:DNA-binding SARP family transcriptional activator